MKLDTYLEIAKMTLLQETPLIQVIARSILPLEKKRASRILSALTGAFISGFIVLLIIVF